MGNFDEVDELFRDDEDDAVGPKKILLNRGVGTLLFRYFLAAAVIDNGGSLSISRRAMSELLRVYEDPDSFRIIIEPAHDDQDLTIKLLSLK